MCPACILTMALIYAGLTSTGGLTALAIKKFHAKTGATKIDPATQPKGEHDVQTRGGQDE